MTNRFIELPCIFKEGKTGNIHIRWDGVATVVEVDTTDFIIPLGDNLEGIVTEITMANRATHLTRVPTSEIIAMVDAHETEQRRAQDNLYAETYRRGNKKHQEDILEILGEIRDIIRGDPPVRGRLTNKD